MCREPVTRTPWSGLSFAYLRRIDIKPGISCSATMISLRPQSARERSATLYSAASVGNVVLIRITLKLNLHPSTNQDMLISYVKQPDAVNPQIAPRPLRSHSPPPSDFARAGGIIGCGTSGNLRHGPESHIHATGAIEAGR